MKYQRVMATRGPQGSWVSMHSSACIGQMQCYSLDKSVLHIANLREYQT